MSVHPTAIVDESARVAESAEIGPYCIVGSDVDIGERTRLKAHVYAEGPLVVGQDNLFYPYCTVGVAPQDLKYRGERSRTLIGDRNTIREFVAIHRGTQGGGMITTIGSDNLLQAHAHVAHDCCIGSHIVLGHGVTMGGHVTIGDWAWVGAFSGIHQFCRIGAHAMIGGYSVITQDVLPYATTVSERPVKIFGANKVGLERRGFPSESIQALQTAFRILTRSGLNTSQALEKIRAEVPPDDTIADLLEFIATSERGFIK
jgi:UDP-N-acetylglucosamine acyltransferase